MNRAYSLVELKTVKEDERVIEGIASTPSTDRMGDILEPLGAQFSLPLPALLFHDSKNPVATVEWAKANKDGIPFRMRFPKAGLLQKVDEAWTMVKAGLIRAVSVGFRDLESAFIKETGGIRFTKWELLEISLVSVPANADATITTVKAYDSETPHLPVHQSGSVVRLDSRPSAPAGDFRKKSMTTQEQISQWDAKLVSTKEQITQIMKAAETDARVLTEEEDGRIEELEAEVGKIAKHIERLKKFEQTMVAKATPVVNVTNPESGITARGSSTPVISVKSVVPKGIGMARVAMALTGAKGNVFYAQQLARERWPDSPELIDGIKAAVEAGDTTTSGWASQLVPNAVQTDFLELLRPMTIFGKIQGFRRVPFNTLVPIQSAGGTYSWVGEAAAKPVTSLTFTSQTLRWGKVTGIIVITQELARFSSPSAEALVRDDMLQGLARYIDTQFVGAAAAVANVSPAGILNGIASTATTGTAASNFRTDMNNMLNNFTANNVDLSRITLLMSSTQALALSLMVTDLGVALFPNIGINGGTILGFPVIVSENVGTNIIGIDASQILVADDGGISIDVSTEASVEMSTTPIAGDTSPITGAVLKSLWQNNLVGLRCEKFITWVAGRTAAVEYITGNAYVP